MILMNRGTLTVNAGTIRLNASAFVRSWRSLPGTSSALGKLILTWLLVLGGLVLPPWGLFGAWNVELGVFHQHGL
jgi:hypothetical protein